MKAGILTNGGDTPSLNALLFYIRDALRLEGYTKIFGFRDGYVGLMTSDYDDITIAGIPQYTGGTFLSSLRESPLPKQKPDEGSRRLWDAKLGGCLNTISDLKLNLLVVIGGDGTLAATSDFMKYTDVTGCRIIGVPRTIDNDIRTYTYHDFEGKAIETSVCPGFPSAAEKLIKRTWSLRTTAKSGKRVFTLETMGRNAGWLALATVIGFAERCTIPEYSITEDVEKTLCNLCASDYRQSKHLVVGVSEGTTFDGKTVKQLQYGERKLGGAGDVIAKGGSITDENGQVLRIIKGLEKSFGEMCLTRVVHPTGFPNVELEIPIEVRCHHGDYEPRMGEPSKYDVKLAKAFGDRIREMVRGDGWGKMPVLDRVVGMDELDVKVTRAIDISKAEHKPLPMEYYNKDELTATRAYYDFMRKLVNIEAILKEE